MSTTHTSGPWYADPALETIYARAANGDQILIADLTCTASRERETANAALIAAAPDLLAALDACVSGLMGNNLRQARAAIAKARGQA